LVDACERGAGFEGGGCLPGAASVFGHNELRELGVGGGLGVDAAGMRCHAEYGVGVGVREREWCAGAGSVGVEGVGLPVAVAETTRVMAWGLEGWGCSAAVPAARRSFHSFVRITNVGDGPLRLSLDCQYMPSGAGSTSGGVTSRGCQLMRSLEIRRMSL